LKNEKSFWLSVVGKEKESSATLALFLTRVLPDLSEAAQFYSTW